jgi:outer membrane protein OmpA-like peptidoglycan-associated protein
VALAVTLLLVAGACGGGDDEPADSGLTDCTGFFLGTFTGDRSGPFVLAMGEDGSLSAAFVGPDILNIDLSDVASISGLVEEIGLVPGEDITISLSGIEIAPGALSVGSGGVRLGNIAVTLDPAGTAAPDGAVAPTDAAGPVISGDFSWETCTGSGEWTDGGEGGRWQAAGAASGLSLSTEDCDGPIYIGLAPDLGGLDIDLDAFCLSSSVSRLPTEDLDEGVEVGNDGDLSVYTLEETVLFEFGSAALTPAASDTLEIVAEAITAQGPAAATITVIGHTDSIGSAESNLELSKRRAEAVGADLTARIPAAVVSTSGLGEASPKAPNANPDGTDNPEGRRQNRRVEIIVTG